MHQIYGCNFTDFSNGEYTGRFVMVYRGKCSFEVGCPVFNHFIFILDRNKDHKMLLKFTNFTFLGHFIVFCDSVKLAQQNTLF